MAFYTRISNPGVTKVRVEKLSGNISFSSSPRKIRVGPTASGSSSEDNDVLGLILDMKNYKKLDKLDKYCVWNPGKPYVIDGPGLPSASTSARRHCAPNHRILAVNNGCE